MRNNVSKQVLLSVIGVAILVIAVIGVSFALYIDLNYNPGTLKLQFKDDKKYIELTNSMPVSMEEGKNSPNEVSFTLNGTVDGYTIRVLTDDSSTLKPSEVFAYISSDDVSGITFNANGNFATTGQALGEKNVVLGTGTFNNKEKADRTFNIHFWVDNSVVSIGEGETYTVDEYANMKYSLRVSVEYTKNNNN